MKYFSAKWNTEKQQWQENGIALTANDERALVCTVEAIDYSFCAACPIINVRYRNDSYNFSNCNFTELRQNNLYYDFLVFHASASLVKNLKTGDRITAILIPIVDNNGRHSVEFICIRIET
jgi:hypothetical protein